MFSGPLNLLVEVGRSPNISFCEESQRTIDVYDDEWQYHLSVLSMAVEYVATPADAV